MDRLLPKRWIINYSKTNNQKLNSVASDLAKEALYILFLWRKIISAFFCSTTTTVSVKDERSIRVKERFGKIRHVKSSIQVASDLFVSLKAFQLLSMNIFSISSIDDFFIQQ
jgi:hypothetical protein